MTPEKQTCPYCKDHPSSPEKGKIEMDNNGPIVDCPVCDGKGYLPMISVEIGE